MLPTPPQEVRQPRRVTIEPTDDLGHSSQGIHICGLPITYLHHYTLAGAFLAGSIRSAAKMARRGRRLQSQITVATGDLLRSTRIDLSTPIELVHPAEESRNSDLSDHA